MSAALKSSVESVRDAYCVVQSSLLVGVCAGRFSGESRQAATLWLACHDTDAANSEAANKLVAEADIDFPSVFVQPLAEVLSHNSSDVRQAAANTMATGIRVRRLRLSVLWCLPFHFPYASSQIHKAVVGMSLAGIVPRSHHCSVCGFQKR